jgi:hypothetical protein
MHKYVISISLLVDADSSEEAALLAYQQLTDGPAPLLYSVADESGTASEVELDRKAADEFANLDYTADPGNW